MTTIVDMMDILMTSICAFNDNENQTSLFVSFDWLAYVMRTK